MAWRTHRTELGSSDALRRMACRPWPRKVATLNTKARESHREFSHQIVENNSTYVLVKQLSSHDPTAVYGVDLCAYNLFEWRPIGFSLPTSERCPMGTPEFREEHHGRTAKNGGVAFPEKPSAKGCPSDTVRVQDLHQEHRPSSDLPPLPTPTP